MIAFCWSSVSCAKKANEGLLPKLSAMSALMALLRRTSSTGPRRRSSECLPSAKHVTSSIALASAICCFVYMNPALPNRVPGLLIAVVPNLSKVCTDPSMTINIQSPVSPSRRICSPRPNTWTEHAAASTFCSSSVMLLKVGSPLKNVRARCKCLLLSLSIASRNPLPSKRHNTPCELQVTVAVRLTLYSIASSPNVCLGLNCFTGRSSIETVKVPCWMM
mmetsp:Transcript_45096/g.136725  ORF Transcript_45096/g.136725 Transcript_45096/m.136725 type:complete len:220 (-) Transcript_45096:310-969(-)